VATFPRGRSLPVAPRGDGQGRQGIHCCQAAVTSWPGRPGLPSSWSHHQAPSSGIVLVGGTTSASKVPRQARYDNAYYQTLQIGRDLDRGNVQSRGGRALAIRCGRAAGPANQFQQLVLNRDQGFRSSDPIRRRRPRVLGELRHLNSAAPEPQRHRARLHCPCQGDHHPAPLRSPGQRLSI